jgi:hypothetical protein
LKRTWSSLIAINATDDLSGGRTAELKAVVNRYGMFLPING